MKKFLFLLLALFTLNICFAQSPVGRWKKISHTSVFNGQKIDTYSAFLKQRPCADKIVYEINADGTFRLNASASGCDEKYSSMQQRLYSKTQWKIEGNLITTSAVNFAVGQSYNIKFSGNKMTWTGTADEGTIVYQKL